MKATVLSDGGWGTALALLLSGNGHEVVIWGPFPDYIQTMRSIRMNQRFLNGIVLPEKLGLTASMPEAVEGADLIVLASPSQYMRGTLKQLAAIGLAPHQILVNVAKGIENRTLKRISQICEELLGETRYSVLSGPSHAEEVARGVPTAVVAASTCRGTAEAVQHAFMNSLFRVYTSTDVVGVELGGALKNVLAISAGVCDGMGLGDNTKAALLTRGIAEMARFGEALGGRPETFSGLSGIGDLIVTCTSGHSRNRHVGEELGKGRRLQEVTDAMGLMVAEGVKTSESAHALAEQLQIATPIFEEIYASLYLGKDPRQAVRDLMTREPKPERG